jgi:hypothetical protein
MIIIYQDISQNLNNSDDIIFILAFIPSILSKYLIYGDYYMSKLTRRKAILRSAEIALSLPFMSSLYSNEPKSPEKFPTRAAFIYFDMGVIKEDYWPNSTNPISKTLTPIKNNLDNILILGGLDQKAALGLQDASGDHARSSSCFLTGTRIKKSVNDIHAGISIDQVIANKIGAYTKLPSIELSMEAGSDTGGCDSGYGCIYSNNIAWRSSTVPMSKEVNPRSAFNRLFSTSGSSKSEQVQNMIAAENKSLLDLVNADAKSLKNSLGENDIRKMDEYLDSVRSIENRIQSLSGDGENKTSLIIPSGNISKWAEKAKLFYDIMVLAFQTDTTRVATFMLSNSASGRVYSELGITGAYHELSHHGTDQSKKDAITKINQYHLEAFNYFLNKLKSIKEGDKETLLDHCMLTYGSCINDGDSHGHTSLPILLAGKGNNTITSGRYIPQCKGNLNDLYIALANRMSVPIESFGDDGKRPLPDLQ